MIKRFTTLLNGIFYLQTLVSSCLHQASRLKIMFSALFQTTEKMKLHRNEL